MKKLFVLPALALLTLVGAPQSSYALSCVDPEGMIDFIVADENSIVVTATALEQKEHVKEKADKNDINMMYDSGYTGQFLEIKKAHMGTVPNKEWVYFHRDSTWNYLCAGEPPKVGTESVYVINMPNNAFEPVTVSAVYEVDSEMADKLLDAIADEELAVEPTVYEVPKTDWVTRLHDELSEMAFLIKMKLSEWTFWKSLK